MIYIGVDVGKKGAMAILNGNDIEIVPFDKKEYIEALKRYKESDYVFGIIEQVNSMPKQGVASTFNFGTSFGWLQGAFDAFGIPYELVRPQKWKKVFSVTSDKNTSIEVAQRLFPNVSLKRTERCKKDDDNIAEALLMCEYGRRLYSKERLILYGI